MHIRVSDNLTNRELMLLKHLTLFQQPFYFDELYATFIPIEPDRYTLHHLLFRLQVQRWISVASVPVPGKGIDNKFSYVTYVITDTGRTTAEMVAPPTL